MKTRRDHPAPIASPPVVEVARPLLPPAERVLPYLQKIDAARRYSNFGPLVSELERRLSARLDGGAGVVAGANATQLITVALRALAPAVGGLCIMPSWTFAATAHAVVAAGLIPWFVDVTEAAGDLSPAIAQRALAEADGPVACVTPVAPFGAPIDPLAWADFQQTTGVPVVIDAAAGFDAVRSAPVPTVISLHATKVLGAGEGGYLASTDLAFLAEVRRRTNFGFQGTRAAEVEATNAKMSEYSAAVALAALDEWDHARLRWLLAATKLRGALAEVPGVRFQPGWGVTWVSSTCVVRLSDRVRPFADRVSASHGVAFRNWWGEGCHLEPAFRTDAPLHLPETQGWAQASVGLPFYPDLTDHDAARIAAAVRELVARASGRMAA